MAQYCGRGGAVPGSNIAKEVHLIHRRDKLRSEKILQDKIMDKATNGNISPALEPHPEEVLGDASGVTGVRLKSTLTGEENTLDLAGVFIAIGQSRTPTCSRAS